MVALITGSSSGIGQSIAILFAKNGYDVVINYNSNKDGALKTEDAIKEYGVKTLVIKCDISNEEEVINMKEVVKNKFGKIDVLVNNASIAIDKEVESKSKEDFKKILDVNLIGTFLVSKYFSSIIDNGSIINITSTNAIDTYYPMGLDYDASKAGVISLTHNFAVMLAPNIRVNAVACGWVDTPMNKDMDKDFRMDEEEKILLKRFGNPKEIAEVVLFIASSKASYINNEIIRVDGGSRG